MRIAIAVVTVGRAETLRRTAELMLAPERVVELAPQSAQRRLIA